jgi:branched-chain amino acid aminotransferase
LWYEGTVLEESRATLDFTDRGLLLGDGLFETMVVFRQQVFRLDDHLDRLLAGARVLRLPVDRTSLAAPADTLARRTPDGTGVIRLTVTRGPGPRGLRLPPDPKPTIFASLAAWQLKAELPQARLAVATGRRNPTSPLSRLKSLAYLDNVLALEEAVARGADDALILSTGGRISCASAANVFAIRDGMLLTPPEEDGILPGITRRLVLEMAPAMGLAPRETSLHLADLQSADAVFTTNSVALVVNVAAIDDQPLPGSGPALVEPMRHALMARIRAECPPPSAPGSS